MHTGGSSLCDAPPRRPVPSPKAKDSRLCQPPIETIAVVAEQPSQPTIRYNAIADTEASTHRSGHAATARSTRDTSWAWPPRTARRPDEHSAARRSRPQPASETAPPPRDPAHGHATPRGKPHPASPWERRLVHGRSRARAAKTFPRGTGGTLRKTQAHPRFAFSLALPLSRRSHPPRKARKGGRAPTQGGRQPWERASTRGRTRQSSRT